MTITAQQKSIELLTRQGFYIVKWKPCFYCLRSEESSREYTLQTACMEMITNGRKEMAEVFPDGSIH